MGPVVEIANNSTDGELAFVVRNVGRETINALRRIILSEIENVAVMHTDVKVSSNTCPLHDDIIAKRIAMIPIKMSAAEVTAYVPESLTLELSVKNEGKLPLDVTSKDIEVAFHGRPYPEARVLLPPCDITGDYILITRLQPGQEIKLAATATKGTADTHAAYAVASIASYGYELDKDAIAAARDKLEEDLKSVDAIDARNALNRFDTIDCQRIYKTGPDNRPVGYSFRLESESGYTCAEIVDTACKVLKEKFSDPHFAHSYIRGDDTHLRYMVYDQDHTMGGVLQSVAMDHAEALGLLTVGYYCPHPLEQQISVNVKSKVAVPDADGFMNAVCELCTKEVDAMYAQMRKVITIK